MPTAILMLALLIALLLLAINPWSLEGERGAIGWLCVWVALLLGVMIYFFSHS